MTQLDCASPALVLSVNAVPSPRLSFPEALSIRPEHVARSRALDDFGERRRRSTQWDSEAREGRREEAEGRRRGGGE